MFASARKAASLIFDPAFAGIVLKAVALTVLLFVLLAGAAEIGLHHLPLPGWVRAALEWLAPVLVFIPALFLGAPVAAIFATLFLDEIAAKIEARTYPVDPKASDAPLRTNLVAGLRLAGLVIGVDIVLLPFDFALPGLAEIATLLANGWLLGREYFELAALRHLSRGAADNLRHRHRAGVFGAGTVIALLTMVPLVNLFTPLFACAFMVHLFKTYSHEDEPSF